MTWCPFAIVETGPGFTDAPLPSLGLVLHVNADTGDPGPYFTQCQCASSHWQVMLDGTLLQYVDSDLQAWAQMAGNGTYHSVETEGYPVPTNGYPGPLTQAQLDMLARLYAWGHQTYGWALRLAETPGDRGFGWHGMGGVAWGDHPYCPGDLRKAQRQTILDAAAVILNPPTPTPTPTPTPAPASHPKGKHPMWLFVETGVHAIYVTDGMEYEWLPDMEAVQARQSDIAAQGMSPQIWTEPAGYRASGAAGPLKAGTTDPFPVKVAGTT